MAISMKKLITLFILIITISQVFAQTEPKTKSKTIDKDLFLNKPKMVQGFELHKKTMDNSYLLIVDDKIYNGLDSDFKNINRESIELIRTISDTLSKTSVKHVLIFKTKTKF
jgi:hypothetical protein